MENYTWSLEEVFNNRTFKVPDYQRGYAWEKSHCLDLLEDLELLPDSFDHYTGTLVFHKNGLEEQDEEGANYVGYDIVDGQQRLTTLVILISVIKDFFPSDEKHQKLVNGLEKKYLFINRLSDGNPFFKLTLNEDCREFFKTDILGRPGVTGKEIRSHERLDNAKQTFTNYLEAKREVLEDQFTPWLSQLLKKVTTQLKMGRYMVKKEAEVGVIFEVMNNRGKDLTELEKVKNYLLYLTTKIDLPTADNLSKKINFTWSHIYKRFMSAGLGSGAENQFLRAHWLIYADHLRKNWNGSKSIKGKFNLRAYQNKNKELFNDLVGFVDSLNYASIAFADLEKPNRAEAFNAFDDSDERQRVVYWSNKLVRTRTLASFRPLLMAVRLKFPKDSELYSSLLQLLEKFAFRVYNMQRKRADTGQSSVFKYAYELYNDEIEFTDLVSRLKGLLHWYSNPSTFDSFWEFDSDNNDWYHWKPLKYLLYEYEEHKAGNKGVTLPWNTVTTRKLENTIEHIFPQTPEDPDEYWPERFTDEDYKIYIHDIGNLCLTYDNSSYRNFGFDRKKGKQSQDENNRCYANSPLFQERALAAYSEWTPEAIEERREKIVEWAKERWGMEFEQVENVEADIEEDENMEDQEFLEEEEILDEE